MAANLKQRLIKAGRDFNFAEGVKVLAEEDITAGQIVAMSGYAGPFLKVVKADLGATDGAVAKRCGRLLIAKHDIPANGYGVCLPWKLVTGVDTSASAGVGAPVYLNTAGTVQFTATATARQRIVGSVVVDDTADAATPGAYMFSGELDFGKLAP